MIASDISVLLHSAELTRVTRKFKFMSPRVVLTFGAQKKVSQKHKQAGKYPEWLQLFELEGNGDESVLELAVYDSKLKPSRLIGSAQIDLEYARGVGFIDEYIELKYKGKTTGKLWIILRAGQPPQDVLHLPPQSIKLEQAPLYPSIPGLQVKLLDSKVVGMSYKAPGFKDEAKIVVEPGYVPPPFYEQ